MPERQALSENPTRAAQRSRTRRAIVEATRRLLGSEGTPPTIDAIAAEAEVSRRTVYLHFPSIDQLVLDAAIGALSEAQAGPALARATTPEVDGRAAADRVDELATAILELAPTTLPLGRQIIKLTVDTPTPLTDSTVRRGFRRVEWMTAALEPLRSELTLEQFERLLSALTVLIGFESMIVLQDVRGLDPQEELRTVRWAARALVAAMLAEPRG